MLEAGLVVLGLLLALWLSDRQDRRRLERDVAETREALIAEVQANREMLTPDYLLPHHRRLRAGLQTVPSEDQSPQELQQGAFALFETGIHFPTARDTVWPTASDSGISQHMDRDEVFALADVYGAQDQLLRIGAAYYPLALELPTYGENPAGLRGALVGTGYSWAMWSPAKNPSSASRRRPWPPSTPRKKVRSKRFSPKAEDRSDWAAAFPAATAG